jgi:hypothetical protein
MRLRLAGLSRRMTGDVAPLGREEGWHGLCPWGSTGEESIHGVYLNLITLVTGTCPASLRPLGRGQGAQYKGDYLAGKLAI